MTNAERRAFLVVTTGRLPEAHFAAQALLRKGQRVAILSVPPRRFAQKARVFVRLGRRRGVPYLADLLLGRVVGGRMLDDTVHAFPELTPHEIAAIRREAVCPACNDLHDTDTLAFVRDFGPDYIVMSGAPACAPHCLRLRATAR